MASRLPSRLLGVATALTMVGSGLVLAGSAQAAHPAPPTSPKNVIVLIGDGMGFNHVDLYNAFTTGKVHYQVERGGDHKVNPYGYNSAKPDIGFQSWNLVGMETSWAEGSYDPTTAWIDFPTNKEAPTDSGAAGTAMATGVKTYNGAIGVGPDRQPVENLSERAIALGKAAGVVTNVPFSHATPADYSVHNVTRKDYAGIAHAQLTSVLNVVMGAGHPQWDDDHQKREQPKYSYISDDDFAALSSGRTPFTFVETRQDFEKLAQGNSVPDRVFGITQTGSTNQQGRSEGRDFNDVPSLTTMAQGALNVLSKDSDGFFLMVEGGAIDWAGHANQSERDIEEVSDFVDMVNSVEKWVETNSSWDDTLVMVTADHETGYLSGDPEGDFTPIQPQGVGTMPLHSWNSGDHTNQLVGMWYKGTGSQAITDAAAKNLDPVRGSYIMNTDPARWLLDTAWKVSDTAQPTQTPAPTGEASAMPSAAPAPVSTQTPDTGSIAAVPTTVATDKPSSKNAGTHASGKSQGHLARTGASTLPLALIASACMVIAASTLTARRLLHRSR